MKRALVAGLVIVPIALTLLAWAVLPGWIERRAGSAVRAVGDTLDVEITYDELVVEGPDRMVLRGVEVRPSDALPTEGALFVAPTVTSSGSSCPTPRSPWPAAPTARTASTA